MEDSVDSSNSVFDLLTKLCQKFAKNASGKSSKSIKKLRAKSYGLLLSKQGVVEDVHGNFHTTKCIVLFLSIVLHVFQMNFGVIEIQFVNY